MKPDLHEHIHPHSDSDVQEHIHQDTPEHVHQRAHSHADTKKVLNRLSRAIGHLNAVRGMVEKGRDCSDVLIQLAAVRSAINGICEVILKDHIDHCIVDAVKTGDTKTLKELNHAIELLLK